MTMPSREDLSGAIMASGQAMVSLALMLKAGWFEYRWRQTGDQQLSGWPMTPGGSY